MAQAEIAQKSGGFDMTGTNKSRGEVLKRYFISGFPQALEIIENLEITRKSSMHGIIMEFEEIWIIMEKSWNCVK